MAEPYKRIYKVDLNQQMIMRDVGMLATFDSKANRFGAQLYRDGAEVPATGYTVTGYFIRPDEQTVPIPGTVEGNLVYVDLLPGCYLYDGAFEFTLKIKLGDEEKAVLMCYGNVKRSRTDATASGGEVIVTVTNAEKLGGKPPEAYAAVNLLDNSNFSNPVNQRGQTSYSIKGGSAYTIDRWSVWFGESGTVTVSDGCLIITNTSTTAGGSLVQYFEKGTLDLSKTYTRVYEKDDGELVISHSGVYDGTSEQSMQIAIPANTTVKIKRIALYEGVYTADTLPPYVPKGYGAEVAECKRYYRRIKNAIVQVSPNIQAYYRASSIFYEEMRTVPTVTILADESGRYGMCSNVAYITDVNDISIVNRENGCLGLATTKENYAGRTMQIYDIELSADL